VEFGEWRTELVLAVWSLESGGLSWCWQCGVWSIIQFLGIGFQFSALGKRY